MARKRVLVTGSAGRLGRAAVRGVKEAGHFVRGLDLHPSPVVDESYQGSIMDPNLLAQAMAGIDTLIHLAATPDDDDFHTKLLPNNIAALYEIMEAARLAGVKRLILASSGQVVWWQRFKGPLPIRADATPSPRGWYAATKMFAESAGRSFAHVYGMSVVLARLGWCPRDAAHVAELAATSWGPDVYLSPGDASRFFAAAVNSENSFQCEVIYVCSLPTHDLVYDPEPGEKYLGYRAEDTWPYGAEYDLS